MIENTEWAMGALMCITACLFILGGGVLRHHARRMGSGLRRLREIRVNLPKARRSRLIDFHRLASGVLGDGRSLLADNTAPREARALVPLVTEIRRRGELLLQSRRTVDHFLPSRAETALGPRVSELTTLEKALKSLPRSKMSVEDVLAGRFDMDHSADKGV